MYDALDLAEYVVHVCCFEYSPISNLQLQKIMYYIQGYWSKIFDTQAFSEEICQWPYGPVVPIVYFEYNANGSATISAENSMDNGKYRTIVQNIDDREIIDRIISKCIKIPPRDLVQKTHEEEPWLRTQPRAEISYPLIKNYFKKNNPLNISTEI